MESTDVLKLLGDQKTIGKIGFLAGMIHVMLSKETPNSQPTIFISPLSTLCCAAIFGSIYSCMSTFVSDFFPNDLKSLISICLILSILFYIMKAL